MYEQVDAAFRAFQDDESVDANNITPVKEQKGLSGDSDQRREVIDFNLNKITDEPVENVSEMEDENESPLLRLHISDLNITKQSSKTAQLDDA